MIVNLLNIIEENTDQLYEEVIHFREYLIKKGIFDRLSFYKALEEFELYLVEEQIEPGEYMASVFELYNPDAMED
jgi:hypothetical protein